MRPSTGDALELEIDRYIGLPTFEHFTIIGYRFCKNKNYIYIFLSHAQLYRV